MIKYTNKDKMNKSQQNEKIEAELQEPQVLK